jgi:hypothetical protein
MPRNEKGFEHERAAFERDIAAARAALDAGDIPTAVKLSVSPAHNFWYSKEGARFELLRELYHLIPQPLDDEKYRQTSWQRELIAELYALWPKVTLDAAILRHDFPEAAVNAEELLARLRSDDAARQRVNETTVTGAESIQFAKYRSTWLGDEWGVLSRGRYWLKFWDLETGELIHAREHELPMQASSISRDGSHVLISYPFISEAEGIRWSTTRFETYRKARLARAGTYEKSEYKNAKYYTVRGEVVGFQPEQESEIDRKEFEANPIAGEILPARTFEWAHSLGYIQEVREEYPPAQAEQILRENELAEKREQEIVRVKKYQTITIEHDDIAGYLPAQTTTFVARDGFAEQINVSDAIATGGIHPYRIKAKLGVEDDESWIEEIIAPGHGVRSMWTAFTSPVTEVLISSDGSVGLANGLGNNFGVWNLWTGVLLREFRGHTGRVTCLCPAVDVSVIASGSEDKTVRLWETFSAECTRELCGHEDVISKVSFSLDATQILSADRGGVMKLWDSRTGECLQTIAAHDGNVTGLCFMLDGKFAVSGSWDKTVKIWNLIDGTCVRIFEFADWVTSIDMTPDGHYLAASSYEGTKVWELIWRLEPREPETWNERARPALEILLNANAAWSGKLSTPIDMSQEEIRDSLRRGGPSWQAWHRPSSKDAWGRVWHLNWNIEETMGYAGFGWLSDIGEEATKIQDDWKCDQPADTQ